MANSGAPADRFRSATEFPKTVETLDLEQANQLYIEMRECLIFTNRSRAQLIRRNEEHKQSAIKLREDVTRLQNLIQQLSLEKQDLVTDKQRIVAALTQEIQTMSTHLDSLSSAFDAVADTDDAQQTQWSILSMPGRFFGFLRAVKAIVMWWRDERGVEEPATPQLTGSQPKLSQAEIDQDRRDNPQMYQDQRSLGQSLLDK